MIPERECGFREQGAAYFVLPTGGTRSVWDFVMCPPKPVDLKALGIAPKGVQIIEVAGHYHVFDVIGENNYPYPSDWIQEAARYGISRKANPKLDFGLLTPDSRLVVIHRKALIENASDYYRDIARRRIQFDTWRCPCSNPEHDGKRPPGDETCVKLWMLDHEVEARNVAINNTWYGLPMAERRMRTFDYSVAFRPTNVTPVYSYAMFGAFPIAKIEVIRDTGAKRRHIETAKAARKSALPVEVVNE